MTVAGERTRLEQQLKLLRGLLYGLEQTVAMPGGVPCSESAQAVADASIRIVTAAARLDAAQRVEDLQERNDSVCEFCQERCKHRAGVES